MEKVKINIVNPKLNYHNIDNEFSIVRFTTSENYIPFGAQFIDAFSQNIKAKSVVFENGRSLYTLFTKAELEKINLRAEIDKIEGAEVLTFSVLKNREIQQIPIHLLVQLLINSLSSPENHRLRFNNLTGKLFLYNESLFERRKFKDDRLITKIPAIEFKVHSDLNLELRITTFTSLLLKTKLDFSRKSLHKYAKYTYSHATKSMRRIIDGENFDAKDVFIIKQEPRKKTVIPFLDFNELDSFQESKMGFMAETLEKVEDKLNVCLQLAFKEASVKNTFRTADQNQQDINSIISQTKKTVHIINAVGETAEDYIEVFQDTLKTVLPTTKTTISGNHKKQALNIRLVHNKHYYDKNGIQDKYDSSLINTQHLTIEDFKYNNTSAVKAVLKELLIKNDIVKKQVSIIDWPQYNFTNDFVFGIKDYEQFIFLKITPSGKMQFEVKEQTLFNQSEFDDLISIFEEDSTVEGVVKNHLGHINVIKRTGLYTIPNFKEIYGQLKAENKNENFKISDVKRWLSDTDIEEKHKKHYQTIFNNWDEEFISKSNLLKIIDHRSVKKKLSKHVFEKTGIVVKSYMRDKTKYDLMDSNLDIHSYSENGKLFYYVGTIGDGMRTKIGRASKIREISGFSDAPIFFDEMLPLMNVDFVRYGDLTVIPFPFKYLREWARISHKEQI
ncbi:hypothetical protein G5B37_06900 [Rasiella rasia]|uniref:Uncharacterized protein n=1 Tax=Rasiella rasia TaxID=2744027 RepID=A0A6G6GLD4_9FLAO|nr:hypothetical protein [Rasiella rasia]QIE59300.1 hypothetical protein G5B37_06900 [Rasiella rasia]